jgi:hypothetical protein
LETHLYQVCDAVSHQPARQMSGRPLQNSSHRPLKTPPDTFAAGGLGKNEKDQNHLRESYYSNHRTQNFQRYLLGSVRQGFDALHELPKSLIEGFLHNSLASTDGSVSQILEPLYCSVAAAVFVSVGDMPPQDFVGVAVVLRIDCPANPVR